MLTKLISYELKSVARLFLPIYGLILAVSTILGLYLHNLILIEWTSGVGGNLFFALLIAILISLYVALYVITIMMIIKRFNSNLLGDEGYLMMTLPVSVETILHSKWISAMVWFIASAIVSTISFFLVVLLSSEIGFADLMKIAHDISHLLQEVPVTTILLVVANLFFGFLFFLFLVYSCMSVAHLAPFSKHKTIWAIVFYIVVSNVSGVLQIEISNKWTSTLTTTFIDTIQALNHVFQVQLLFDVIGLAACFLITQHILTKKLNLN